MGDRITVAVPRESTGRTEIPLGSLNGGLWCDVPPQDIPQQGWTDGYDFVVDDTHRVKTRRGRYLISNLTEDSTLTTNFPSDKRIYGMHQHRSSITNDSLLAVIGDQIARYNGSTWAWLGGGTPITFDNPGIPTFMQIGDGTDEYTFVCVEGTKLLWVKQDGTYAFVTTSSGSGMTIDIEPKWCANYINRAWFAGDSSYGTWLYASESGDPLGWDATGSSDLDCQAFDIGWTDGDDIVGIAVKFGLLFIFKKRSIWYLNAYTSDTPGEWEIKCFTPAVGGATSCGYTIQDIGTDVIYASHDGDFRTLKDTDKTGLFETSSLSARQLKTYLSEFDFDDCCSILDKAHGWYLLAAQGVGDSTHMGYIIYDFAKKTGGEQGQGSPGLWYRIADMQEYVDSAFIQTNSRSCFVRSTLFGVKDEILSGGYEGCLFREFGQVDEAMETAEASKEDKKIRGWLVGKHVSLEDFVEFDLYSISAIVSFGDNPFGSYLQLGALLDPDDINDMRVNVVTYDDSYGVPFIWDVTNWDEGYWDASTNRLADSAIDGKARTFAAYVSAYGSDMTLYKVYAALRPGRI